MERQSSILWKTWLKVAACATFALMMACSDSGNDPEPEPTPTPTPGNTAGSIGFSLKDENGTGIPADGPVKVESTKGAEVVISQKSSYTDPNGQVYTCEPKASISLEATADTVYAKDIKALTTLNGNPKVQSEQSGTNPVKKTTFQVFSIGGQEIVFDLAHEIYTYTNSKQQKIEMPYIQVSQAKYGSGETAESKAAAAPITLRSLSMSRVSVTDSTLYEVDAKFNVEVATVNTKESQKQTLDFEVNYLAVVENVTELTGVLEYSIEGGTEADATEHQLKGGEELNLTLKQHSMYADGNKAVYETQPQATLSLKAANAQVFVGNVEELKNLVDTEDAKTSQEGNNPVTHSYRKQWGTKKQSFDWTTVYQVCIAETGEEMPYLKVGEPKLVGIEATERTSRASVNDTVFYDMKATFEVELEAVNVAEEHKRTLTVTVDYEGGVVTTTQLTPALAYSLEQTEYALKGGEEKEINIRQSAQYKNGDQAVYSHEPVAALKLGIGQATVYGNSLEALKTCTAGEAQTAKEGTNPLKHTYQNTWKAGGQTFAFSNSYQVFTATSGDEMPYLKVGEPKLVGIEATERASRASVNDTVFYDLTATFEVELIPMNIEQEAEKLTFAVNYEGAVVTTTQLTPVLEYTLQDANLGEGNKLSLSIPGYSGASRSIQVKSAFLNGESIVQQYNSAISFKSEIEKNNMYAEDMEQLKTLMETEDAIVKVQQWSDAQTHTYEKTFSTYGIDFHFESSYSVNHPEGYPEMPYLKVGEPRLVSIETVEPESRVVISGIISSHRMKAIFEVELTPMNIDLPAEKLTIELNYEGSIGYNNKEVGELVSTEYRKDMIYLEPHGNLLARTSCVVYRDRKYEDGTVVTDSIYGGPWFMLECSADIRGYDAGVEQGVSYGSVSTDYNNSGIYIVSSSIEIPSFNEFSSLESHNMNRNVPGDYSTYLAEADRSAYNSANPVEGWYYTKVSNQKYGSLLYSGQLICDCMLEASYYDRFLYVDGKLIDFAEFRPSWDDGVFTASDVSGGKVYTLECKGTYAGQEVHLKTQVTVTAKK